MRALAMIKDNKRAKTKLLKLILLVVVLGFVYKFFEPVFVYKFGWKNLPAAQTAPFVSAQANDRFKNESQEAEQALRKFYAKERAPAISVAVSQKGALLWHAAVGYADLDNKIGISLDDAFRLGSTSKALTATAVAALVDKQKLEFDTPMGELDASLNEDLRGVTLKQVMSHRAGIRNYRICFCFPVWERLNQRSYLSVRDSIGVIEGSPTLEPDKQYQYTSLGYNLAGLAAEQASGKKFADVLSDEVFTPLDMRHSSLEKGSVTFALPYEVDNGRYKPTFDVNNSIRWPSGGILSTPTDLTKLGNAVLTNELVSKSVLEQMLTIPEAARQNGGDSYALGWRVSDWKLSENHTVKAYHHNGVAVGSQSVFVIFPEHDIVVSAMMNKNGTSVRELAKLVDQLTLIFLRLE